MLLYPEAESPVLVLCQIVAGTLRSELFAEPIEHRRQISLGEFLMLLPSGYDGRLEFLFAEFRWVSLVGLELPNLCPFGSVGPHGLWRLLGYLLFLLVGQKHTYCGCHAHPPRHIRSFFHRGEAAR